jgi:lipopolysaccharide/colanic/teichoic acid biosynthesis glycosyltransferase
MGDAMAARGTSGMGLLAPVARRGLDIVVSFTLIVATLPLLLIALTGSAISLRAWPVFTQERIGRDGTTFRFLKVRTLPVHTPRYTDKHQLDAAEIPAFCTLLRRLHLDELPQLLLVLRGHMAMVGPRPEMACLHEQMPASFATARTRVRPGATGLWQVSEASADLIHVAPQYDLYYLANRSLRLDLWVLARTVRKMLGVGGHVTLAAMPRWVADPLADDAWTELADEVQTAAPAFGAAAGR